MSEVEWLKKFGKTLSDMLKDARMTQRELADATGLSESAISNYVNGKQIPTVRAIINICYELGCNIDDLIDFGERVY